MWLRPWSISRARRCLFTGTEPHHLKAAFVRKFQNEFTHDWRFVIHTIRKPNVKPLLATLRSTLSSHQPNDDISGDLAELVGFDDIELVMEILDNRAFIVQEVSTTSVSSFSEDS